MFTQFVGSVQDFILGPVTETMDGPWGDFRLEDRLQKILFEWAPVSDWNGEDHHYHGNNDSDLYVVYSEDEHYIIDRIHVKTSREKMKAIDDAIKRVNEYVREYGPMGRGTSVFSAADVRLREYESGARVPDVPG